MTGKTPETIRYTADAVVIREDGSVLLIERKKPPYQGRFALPGGHVDQGETSLAAAVRELREETGVTVDADDLIAIGVFDAPDRDPRGRYVSVAYLVAVPTSTTARAADDAKTVEWVPLSHATSLDLAFDHTKILAAVTKH